MPDIGPLELVVILVIVLLFFGPKRLPGLGRQLGTGMREFRDSVTGKDRDDREEEHEQRRDALPPAEPAVGSAPAREPEVVTAEARPEDQAAPRRDA